MSAPTERRTAAGPANSITARLLEASTCTDVSSSDSWAEAWVACLDGSRACTRSMNCARVGHACGARYSNVASGAAQVAASINVTATIAFNEHNRRSAVLRLTSAL